MPTRKRQTKHPRYNGGILRIKGKAKLQAEINVAYRRLRSPVFAGPDRERLARNWIDLTQIALANDDRPLSALQTRDAQEAVRIAPEGVSLTEAMRFYIRHNRKAISHTTFEEAALRFLEHKGQLGLRPESLANLTWQIRKVIRDLGPLDIQDVTTEVLSAWLSDRDYIGVTRNNYRRTLCDFFGWLVDMEYLRRNPASKIANGHVDETLPEILDTSVVTKLMLTAEQSAPEFVCYMAIGFFAGIRPLEIVRLEKSADQGNHIHVLPAGSKVRKQRYVTISNNLRQWLDRYGMREGICGSNFTQRFRSFRREAGVDAWPKSIMRHTFASHHLAYFQDAGKTAFELGHRGQDMLYRHYRNLVKPEDAYAYWAIEPSL